MFPLSSTARTHLALGYRIATGILAIAVTVFVGYVLGLFLASLVQDPSVNRTGFRQRLMASQVALACRQRRLRLSMSSLASVA